MDRLERWVDAIDKHAGTRSESPWPLVSEYGAQFNVAVCSFITVGFVVVAILTGQPLAWVGVALGALGLGLLFVPILIVVERRLRRGNQL